MAHVSRSVGGVPPVSQPGLRPDRRYRQSAHADSGETSTYSQGDRFAVSLATSGGNQSWSGLVKEFDATRSDFLFVVTGEGRRWFIPATEIEGRRTIRLGGPKYSEFEVDLGRPLEPAGLQSPESGGSAGAGEPGRTVNPVAMPEWVRFPPPPSASAEKAIGRTRISENHQLTIPIRPFKSAGLEVGDLFRVEAAGPGRLSLTRCTEFSKEQNPLFSK